MPDKRRFISVCILMLAFALTGARCNEKPGEGELAKRGYAFSQPIIEALENYHKDNQTYPQFLKQLSPKYLNDVPANKDGLLLSYFYREDQKRYELEFTYDAPVLGICKCTYYSDTKRWSCIDMI